MSEYAIRNTLIILGHGKKMVQIIAGGNALQPGIVTAADFGVVVLGKNTIVSTCKIENIRQPRPGENNSCLRS